jgi:release factor H-coupled RctB family protein
MTKPYVLVANDKCWIEDISLSQLEKAALFPGIEKTVGLPDLHPGKTPVGAVYSSKTIIHPFLIGNDIGCGMSLFSSRLPLRKFRLEKVLSRFQGLSSLKEIPLKNPFKDPSPIKELGTIGGWNHFAELQALHKVYLKDSFDSLGLDPSRVHLLVHSGSRDFGQRIYEEFLDLQGYPVRGDIAMDYLKKHDSALLWAKRNRFLVAIRVLSFLGNDEDPIGILDSFHNFIQETNGDYIHRKGAVSALEGPVVIPGSRGDLSYVVKPTEDTSKSLFSLSHGAGRKWHRGSCKGRLEGKYKRGQISVTKLKSAVVTHNKDLLYEEAPEAYKKVEDIIEALREAGLCEVICSLKPLMTIKI